MAINTDISPRKSPRQARSAATVEVIHDATLQVLVSQGLQALTTARVADRAGVSVGSIYQYYPNKQALLIAVLERHLETVIRAVEQACAARRGQPLAAMAEAVVRAYVDAKLHRPDVSRALYAMPSSAATDTLVARITVRGQLALCDLLASCSDARVLEPTLVAAVWAGALVGPVQMLLTEAIPLERSAVVREQLIALSLAYLRTVARPVHA